jgi:hypothetical protein
MAKASQDPPSPVDAYDAYQTPQVYGSAGGTTATPAPPSLHAHTGELNELAVAALIATCIGFSIPGLVMGHIALRQIKRNGQSGHGVALAAVIAGYALTLLVLVAVVAFVIFMIFVLSTADSAVNTFGDIG